MGAYTRVYNEIWSHYVESGYFEKEKWVDPDDWDEICRHLGEDPDDMDFVLIEEVEVYPNLSAVDD